MADLEKLALRRDRGYLIRLILLIGVGILVSVFVFGWLTGSRVKGCMADRIGQAPRVPPMSSDAMQVAQRANFRALAATRGDQR